MRWGALAFTTHSPLLQINIMLLSEMSHIFELQHSSSNAVQPKACCKMFDFCRGKRFGERVGNHVSRGTVHQLEGPLFDDPVNEMIADVDMFGLWVILMVLRESNH